jgi:hypothetical protein
MVNGAAYSLRERVASRVSLLHRVLRDPTERLNQDQNTIIGDMSQPAHGCLEELSDMRGKVIWVGDGRSLSSHQSQEDNVRKISIESTFPFASMKERSS